MTTGGLFGDWKRIRGYVREEQSREGPAAFKDNVKDGVYHLLLDDYKQYLPFETANIQEGKWKKSDKPGFPGRLKHGSVTPLLREEWEAIRQRFPP